jgi:hypothetical protein
MWFVRFMRSMTGRLLRVAVGLSLVAYGSTQASLVGLVLMMIGMVPAVTGVASICLLEEVLDGKNGSDLGAVGHAPHIASRHG